MDIFNKKKVATLEAKLRDAELEREHFKDELNYAMQKYRALQVEVLDSPKDCKLGRYCRVCEFGKFFDGVYVCGKGESCKNFTPRRKEA